MENCCERRFEGEFILCYAPLHFVRFLLTNLTRPTGPRHIHCLCLDHASKGDARAQALLASLHAAELSHQMQRVQLREIEAAARAAASTATRTERKLSQQAAELRNELSRTRSAASDMREQRKMCHNELASSTMECAVSQGAAQQAKTELFAARAAHASSRAESVKSTALVKTELAAEVALAGRYAAEVRALKVASAAGVNAYTGGGAAVVALRQELASSEASVLRERAAVETLGARATTIVNLLDSKLKETSAAHEIALARNVAEIESLTAQMARMKAENARASHTVAEEMLKHRALSQPRTRTSSSLSSPRATNMPSSSSSGGGSFPGTGPNSLERGRTLPISPQRSPTNPSLTPLSRSADQRLSVGQRVQLLETRDNQPTLRFSTRRGRAESPTLAVAETPSPSALRTKRRFKPMLSLDIGMCTP